MGDGNDPHPKPILYTVGSLRCVDAMTYRFAEILRERALQIARHGGRHRVTTDDIYAAFDAIDGDDFDWIKSNAWDDHE